MGLDDRIGPKFLQAGIGFGGSCFPKDVIALKQLAGNSGYHFQLLNAVIEVNELQKRRVIGKLAEAPRHARRQARRAARPRVQAEHRRHARGDLARAQRAAAGRRARTVSAYDPVAEERGARADPRRRASPTTRSAASATPTPSCSSPSGTEFKELDWAEVAAAMAGNVVIDGRNALDPAARRAPPGSIYEGIGAAR